MILCEYAHTKCDHADDNCYDARINACFFYKRFKKEEELERKINQHNLNKKTLNT